MEQILDEYYFVGKNHQEKLNRPKKILTGGNKIQIPKDKFKIKIKLGDKKQLLDPIYFLKEKRRILQNQKSQYFEKILNDKYTGNIELIHQTKVEQEIQQLRNFFQNGLLSFLTNQILQNRQNQELNFLLKNDKDLKNFDLKSEEFLKEANDLQNLQNENRKDKQDTLQKINESQKNILEDINKAQTQEQLEILNDAFSISSSAFERIQDLETDENITEDIDKLQLGMNSFEEVYKIIIKQKEEEEEIKNTINQVIDELSKQETTFVKKQPETETQTQTEQKTEPIEQDITKISPTVVKNILKFFETNGKEGPKEATIRTNLRRKFGFKKVPGAKRGLKQLINFIGIKINEGQIIKP